MRTAFVIWTAAALAAASPVHADDEERPVSYYTDDAGQTVELKGWVNVNDADALHLARLPGIDIDLARAIVLDRDLNGPFASPEDVLRVEGLSIWTFKRVGPHLRTEGRSAFIMRRHTSAAVRPQVTGRVNVNTATVDQLMLLPGITAGRASSMVRLRDRLGELTRVDQLREAPGITRARFARMAPYLTLRGPTTIRVVEPSVLDRLPLGDDGRPRRPDPFSLPQVTIVQPEGE